MTPGEFVVAADSFARLAPKQRLAVIQAVQVCDGREDARGLAMFEAHVIERAAAWVSAHVDADLRWRPVRTLLRDELDARLGLLIRRRA